MMISRTSASLCVDAGRENDCGGDTRALLTALGYGSIDAVELAGQRVGKSRPLLSGVLAEALRKLNPWLDARGVAAVVRRVEEGRPDAPLDANETAHAALLHGVSVIGEVTGSPAWGSARIVDFDDPSKNDFAFATVSSDIESIADMTLVFVNGVPLVAIAEAHDSASLEEVVGDLVWWPEQPSMRAVNATGALQFVQLLIARRGDDAVYGAVGAPAHAWSRWTTPAPDSSAAGEDAARLVSPPRHAALLNALLAKDVLLDFVRNFVVFDRDKGFLRKRIARAAQFDAVSRTVARVKSARQPAARGGIIALAHGSGRSLALALLSARLASTPATSDSLVIVVSDRRQPARDASNVFVQWSMPRPLKARSASHLCDLVSTRSAHAITVTHQKFRAALNTMTRLAHSASVFVLIDEPSGGPGKPLAARLRRVMPDACVVSFCGSPIRKKDRELFESVGPYVFRYGMDQSIADGLTVPLRYEQRTVLETPQPNGGGSDEDLARLRAVAADIVRDFVREARPKGFKAQILAKNCATAMRLKALLREMGAPECAVVTSAHFGTSRRDSRYEKTSRRDLLEKFADPSHPLKILVVCEIAEIDAALQQVLYLDTQVREYSLLRTFASVNRVVPGKQYGRVVDYASVRSNLERSLRTIVGTELRETRAVSVVSSSALPPAEKPRRRASREFVLEEVSP